MDSPPPTLEQPLSPENEAATARLESMARILGEGVPALDGYASGRSALLARSSDFFRQQADKLAALAAKQNAILPSQVFKHIHPIFSRTAEVMVYPHKDRVYKATRATKGFQFFGYTLFCNDYRSKRPRFHYVEATPSEYLSRLALTNRVFGSDNRFEGVTIDDKGKPQIVTSQHYFNSAENHWIGWIGLMGLVRKSMKEQEIGQFMTQKGFLSLDHDRAWYRPLDGVIVDDAHTENFKYKKNGEIAPIDLMVIKVSPEKLKEYGWNMEMPKGYKSSAQEPLPIPQFAPEQPRLPNPIAGLRRLHLVPKKEEAEKQQSLQK